MPKEVGVLYKTDGTITEVLPANGRVFVLQDFQKYVNGYIEVVPGSRPHAYWHDSGLIHGLPENFAASQKFGQKLFGNVIQVFRSKEKLDACR